MFWSLGRVGKVSGVPFEEGFEEGRVGKKAIIGVGGVVDIRLWFLPLDGGLVAEVINVVWVIGRGKGYGSLRCGWVRVGWSGGSIGW